MRMFELLPRPLGSIFRKLTHLACNSRKISRSDQTGVLVVIEEERPMGDAANQVATPVRKVDTGASHAC